MNWDKVMIHWFKRWHALFFHREDFVCNVRLYNDVEPISLIVFLNNDSLGLMRFWVFFSVDIVFRCQVSRDEIKMSSVWIMPFSVADCDVQAYHDLELIIVLMLDHFSWKDFAWEGVDLFGLMVGISFLMSKRDENVIG